MIIFDKPPAIILPHKPKLVLPDKAGHFMFVGGKGPFSASFVGNVGFFSCNNNDTQSIGIGTADPNRWVVAAFGFGADFSNDNITGITGVTIGGVSAHVVSAFSGNLAADGFCIAIAKVPTGTTATLAFNWTGPTTPTTGKANCSVWRLLNVTSATFDDTAAGGGVNATSVNASVTIQNKGFAVYGAGSHPISTTGSSGITQSGDTSRINSNNGTQYCHAAGDNSNVSGSPTTPSVSFVRSGAAGTRIAACGASWH